MLNPRAQEAAENICKSLGLKMPARPVKWLTKHRNREGYQNKPTSARSRQSLRVPNAPLPITIPDSKAKASMYRRMDCKAFYVYEVGYKVTEALPSASPGPVKRWTCCAYCNKIGHKEEVCFTKRNERIRREAART